MPRVRSVHWAAFLAVPLLVVGMLVMHGLGGGVSTPGAATATDHTPASEPRNDCADCPGPHHVLVACVAVLATLATWRLASRRTCVSRLTAAWSRCRASAWSVPTTLARPPDPAWVRLGVLRC